jgi:hypothetical protein
VPASGKTGTSIDEQVNVQVPNGQRDDRTSLGNVQERRGLLIDLSLQSNFSCNHRRQSMTHILSSTLTEISDITDSRAFRSATFSTPLHLFRVGNVVGLLDIENAEGRFYETESDFDLALGKLTLARKAAYSLFRCTPFAVRNPAELSDWRSAYQHGDDVIRELRSETLFGQFIDGELTENIGRRRIWTNVAQAVNRAFAMSALSMDRRVSGYSEEKLSRLIDQICVEQNLYDGNREFSPDFDEIAQLIRAME